MHDPLSTKTPANQPSLFPAAKLLLVALTYFVCGRLGLEIPYFGSHITLIWLPTGIAVAALWRWGYRYWPGIFLGAFATNFSIDALPLLDASIALGNTLGPLLAACLLRQMKFHAAHERAYDILLLVGAAATGMLVSASGGVSSLLIFGLLPIQDAGSAWLSWWAGDFVGVLLAAPLLLSISRAEWAKLSAQWLEFLAWCIATFAISWWVFFSNNNERGYSQPMVFLVLPAIVWAAMRFGIAGSSLAVLLPVLVAALATGQGLGPFHIEGEQQGLFLLWLFYTTLVLVELMVTVLQARRIKAEEVLRESEERTRLILDKAMDAVISTDQEGVVIGWNREAEKMFGYASDQTIGKDLTELIVPPIHRQAHRQGMQRFVSTGKSTITGQRVEISGMRADGIEFPIELTLLAAQRKGRYFFNAFIRDISAQKANDAMLQRLMNLYAALSQCNQAIVRCTSEDELFRQVCLDAVQFGGMKMAWIGLTDETTGMVKPVASHGTGLEYLDGIEISVSADHPSGQGTTGTAIRENRPVWIQNFLNDPRLAPWHQRGASYGWGGVAALPLHRNGKVFGALMLYAAVTDAFDEAAQSLLVGMATDISYALTRFALLEERAKTDETMRIAAVTFETQEAIVITDHDNHILRVNRAFEEMTGYTATEVIGKNPSIFQSGRHDANFYQAMWASLRDAGKWSGEIWDKRKNGEIYPKMLTITAVYDDRRQVTHYVAVARDITLHKQSEQEIHQLAFFDPLTHLPNRRLLLDRLQQAMAVSVRNDRHGALLFLDLDHFKTINDTQGHAIGDLLLVEVAHRLQTCVREGDSVARLGGDEFVVVLEELSVQIDEAATQAEQVAEKIQNELGKVYVLEHFECTNTASLGIVLFKGHQTSLDDLLRHADTAMYQAKTAGRNAIRFYDPAMQAALEERIALETELRQTLGKQQLQLYYQIQMDHLNRPLGAEVLLRWNHPKRGMISPAQFIPLAEESGLIVPIGLWVLQTACAQLRIWQTNPLTCNLMLAVNVSAKQFRQPDFVAQVQRTLFESGIKPAHLKLELTESMVQENVEDTIAKMREIKLLGVGFSMDDFGTGYSSLQYLKRLPLDQIKIDQSFVRDITTDPNDAAIVKTIIAMAEALGLNVIAEGVETEAQREFLDRNGCRAFQGYLFSKPVPVAQFEADLRGGK